MAPLILSRWQFAVTAIYHFFFVPVTLGLSILVALMETWYVKTGDETYKKMTKYWGRLFLINFAMGVVTGIVMEFQFGLNWAEYSRFMGDVFGVPLAIEALLAFYLESTMLGVWTFGWKKLSPKAHAVIIWLVAIGSNLSALWILIANSFMQEPVAYKIVNGKIQLINFFKVATNPNIFFQYPHVLSAGITAAGFFVLTFAAYHLLKKSGDLDFFRKSFKWGYRYALVGAILVITFGHFQGMHLAKNQPMKMAAAEAIWDTEQPAGLSLFAVIDEKNHRNTFDLKIPYLASWLAFGKFNAPFKGINDLQKEFEKKYGPDNYIPPVFISYWSFRLMVGLGFLMLLLGLIPYLYDKKGYETMPSILLKIYNWSLFIPIIAISLGWILTEMGRYPWIVYGLLKIRDAYSKNLTGGDVAFSLFLFAITYALLIVAEIYLLVKYGLHTEPSEEIEEGY